MTNRFWLGICGALAVAAFVAGPANAQDKDQFKCEASTSKAGAKFIGAKTKCVLKCESGARKGTNPYSDCNPFEPVPAPPSGYGGATLECVQKAETKFHDSIVKACTKTPTSCPDCYSGGDCAVHATATVADLEAKLDIFVPLILCDPEEEAGDKAINKCLDSTGKVLSKFAGAKTKCYDKCIASEFKGKLPANSCTVGSPSDQKTIDCIAKAEGKAVAGLDKACYTPGVDPTCWIPADAAGWVGLVEASVDDTIPVTYCGSPSGAFLN